MTSANAACALIIRLFFALILFGWISTDALADEYELIERKDFPVGVDDKTTKSGSLFVWENSSVEGQAIELVMVVLPAGTVSGNVVDVRDSGMKAVLMQKDYCSDPVVALTGGFYEKGEPYPLGLVISDGVQKSEFYDREYGGFFVMSDDEVDVKTLSELSSAYEYPHVIQSSPRIIMDGKSDMRGDDGIRFDRVAIGYSNENDFVIVGAFSNRGTTISFVDFTEAILSKGATIGLSFVDMIAMDGGPSSHIYIKALDRHFGQNGLVYIPNVICFSQDTSDTKDG